MNKNSKRNIRMQFSEDIKFPDKCVYCGKVEPDSTIPLAPPEEENGSNGRMIVFAVPACAACAYAQQDRERQIATLTFTLFLVIFTGVALWILRDHQELFYIAISVFIIALFSSIGILKGSPIYVAITCVNTSTISFIFHDESYRKEFLGMNNNPGIEEREGAS